MTLMRVSLSVITLSWSIQSSFFWLLLLCFSSRPDCTALHSCSICYPCSFSHSRVWQADLCFLKKKITKAHPASVLSSFPLHKALQTHCSCSSHIPACHCCLSQTPVIICFSAVVVVFFRQAPVLVANEAFSAFLHKHCPAVAECFSPTPWCWGGRLQTLVCALIKSRPPVNYRK